MQLYSRSCTSAALLRCHYLCVGRLRATAVLFDGGHFQAVTGLTSHRVYTASGSDLATYLSLWLWFCGTAEPPTPYGSF